MNKKLLITLSLFIVLALAGCIKTAPSANSNDSSDNSQQNEGQDSNADQRPMFDDNFLAASSSDLLVGQKVMVLATANGDGTNSAVRIIIGNDDTNFSELSVDLPPGNAGGLPGNNGNGEGATGDQRPQVQRNNPPELTDEQRAEFQQRFAEGGSFYQGGSSNGGAGGQGNFGGTQRRDIGAMVKITGEIIKFEEDNLTVKLDGGGSTLVFISDTTAVSKVK